MPGTPSYLYRFFAADGRLLYVGITENPGQRWESHMRTQPWWQRVRRQVSEWYPTREAAEAAELIAIRHEQPLFNKMHNPNRPFECPRCGWTEKRRMHVPEPQRGAEPMSGEDVQKLLEDLDQILGAERVLIRDVVPRLRQHDPEWIPYQKLTGVALRSALSSAGVRTISTHNRYRLDPAELPQRKQAVA